MNAAHTIQSSDSVSQSTPSPPRTPSGSCTPITINSASRALACSKILSQTVPPRSATPWAAAPRSPQSAARIRSFASSAPDRRNLCSQDSGASRYLHLVRLAFLHHVQQRQPSFSPTKSHRTTRQRIVPNITPICDLSHSNGHVGHDTLYAPLRLCRGKLLRSAIASCSDVVPPCFRKSAQVIWNEEDGRCRFG